MIETTESNSIKIDLIDCDHDLGMYAQLGGDGIKLLDWLVERQTYYPIALHTMDPVGRENMQRLINRYWESQKDRTEKKIPGSLKFDDLVSLCNHAGVHNNLFGTITDPIDVTCISVIPVLFLP